MFKFDEFAFAMSISNRFERRMDGGTLEKLAATQATGAAGANQSDSGS